MTPREDRFLGFTGQDGPPEPELSSIRQRTNHQNWLKIRWESWDKTLQIHVTTWRHFVVVSHWFYVSYDTLSSSLRWAFNDHFVSSARLHTSIRIQFYVFCIHFKIKRSWYLYLNLRNKHIFLSNRKNNSRLVIFKHSWRSPATSLKIFKSGSHRHLQI